jgi:hypothetical protein
MKRTCTAALLVATLVVTPLFAAENAPPLAPGKPAGTRKAQDEDNTLLYIALGGAAAVGIGLLASGGSDHPAAASTPSTTTST